MTEPSLTFVSELARELGATDPVETYYRPLVGNWAELSAEAERLRAAAKTAAGASGGLTDELGRLDASWSGADADAFVAYMGEIRSASEGVEDALDALAAALDELVTSLTGIVHDAEEVLVDAADVLSESAMLPSGGTSRARAQLRETEQSVKSLHDAAEHLLQGFGQLCDGVDAPPGTASSIEVRHRYPQEQFRLHDEEAQPAAGGSAPASGTVPADPASPSDPVQPAAASAAGASADDGVSPSSADDSVSPSAAGDLHDGKHSAASPGIEQGQAGAVPVAPEPIAAAAPPAAQNQSGGMAMMPMMGGMGGGMGGGGGGGSQHKTKHRTSANRSELFGEPANVTPPVLGEDPKKPVKKPKSGT
ncbi:WXG100 family type VII secretion target [Amycolatopsis saalfeldensis]|uniref:WXG100 family type VII secretion target n=1 Tax=Amycolatopsis saalfeldensis TaxID=394193 RepID=A0A1H8XRW4_9PSEU|nr:WXG100 family type VII secretion target [Amycolatopsis saalfeldensis]SEP42556.1 WXG100 family type VII secretion target [Amycolatopsis saalfeldensis]